MVGLAWTSCRRKRKPVCDGGHAARSREGKRGRCFFFGPADPLRRSRVQPVVVVVVSVWQALGGRWQAGQRRSDSLQAERHDSPDRPLRLPTAFLQCRHGWVTISQNSDLDRCLLLPSDPPSRPLPLLLLPQRGPSQEEYGRYCQLIPAPAAWGSHSRCVHGCSLVVPRRIGARGVRPSETSENKEAT